MRRFMAMLAVMALCAGPVWAGGLLSDQGGGDGPIVTDGGAATRSGPFPHADARFTIINLTNNSYSYSAGSFPNGYYFKQPAFNANGTKLAVAAKLSGGVTEIWTMDYDAGTHVLSNFQQITSTGGTGDIAENIQCAWSPSNPDLLLFLEVHNSTANIVTTYTVGGAVSTLYDPALDTNGLDATNPGFWGASDSTIVVGSAYGSGHDRILVFSGSYPSTTISSDDKNLDPSSNHAGARVTYYSDDATSTGSVYSYNIPPWTQNNAGFGNNKPGYWSFYGSKGDDKMLSLRDGLGWSATGLGLYDKNATLLSNLLGDGGTDFQWAYANHGWQGPHGEILFRAEEYTHGGYGNNIYIALPPVINVDTGIGFVTIQAAIDDPTTLAGHTIQVAAGIYHERLTINKALNLRGAQNGVDPTPTEARTNPAEESVITEEGLSTPNPDVLIEIPSGVTDITIDGFTLYGDPTNTTADTCTIRCWDDNIVVSDNIIGGRLGVLCKGNDYLSVERNRITANKNGVVVQPNAATHVSIKDNLLILGSSPASDAGPIYMAGTADSEVSGNVASGWTGGSALAGSNHTRLLVSGNAFSNCLKGVNIWGSTTLVTIEQNTITGCAQPGIDIKGDDLTINENRITGNAQAGVRIAKHVLNTEDVSLWHNNLGGNGTYGLLVDPAVVMQVDAEENYWGTITPDGVAAEVSGNADYDPWCDATFTVCTMDAVVTDTYVDDGYVGLTEGTLVDWPYTGSGTRVVGYDAFATIQAGVDAVNGSTVHVAAGLYAEYVTVNKALNLLGPTAGISKVGYPVPTNYAWDTAVEAVISNPTPQPTVDISVVDLAADDIVFQGFVVQSLNAPPGSANDHLLRINAQSAARDNIIIENNIIGPNTNLTSQTGTNGRMGLYFASPYYPTGGTGVTNTIVSHNKIFDCRGNGDNVFIWGSAAAYSSPALADYSGTVIEYNEIYGSHRSGVEIAGGVADLTIQHNTIHSNSSQVNGAPYDANLKWGNGIAVIRMGSDKTNCAALGADGLTIAGNTIRDNEKNGVYFGPINTNHSLTGNTITGNGQDGVRVDLNEMYYGGTATPCLGVAANIAVTGSRILNNASGAGVLGTPSNSFILDATNNNWGSGEGPLDSAGSYEVSAGDCGPSMAVMLNAAPSGSLGNAVTENVDYCPWTIDAKITLRPQGGDTCYKPGDALVVEVYLSDVTTANNIVGGDFFLEYDETRLDFVGAVPGDAPFTTQVYESVNEAAGTIDYGVGVTFADPGTKDDTVMARISFTVLTGTNSCSLADLVAFRLDHDPPTKLSDYYANAVYPALYELAALAIDSAAPTITGTVDNGSLDAGCDALNIPINVTVTDNCEVSAADVTSVITSTSGMLDVSHVTKVQTDSKTVTISGYTVVTDVSACSTTVAIDVHAVDCPGNPAVHFTTNGVWADTTAPTFVGFPLNRTQNADAGLCTAVLDPAIDPPTGTDCHGPVVITYVRSDNPALTLADPFPAGTTTITWKATDNCSNSITQNQTVTIFGVNDIWVDLEIDSLTDASVSRCITFEVWTASGTMVPRPTVVSFTPAGTYAMGATMIQVPCGSAYTCITARDKLHSLRRAATLTTAGGDYEADFTATATKRLISGNLNDDKWIDILDFGVFSYQWSSNYGSGGFTTCTTPYPHADVTGDATVGTGDFSVIAANYLKGRDPNCFGPSLRGDGAEGDKPLTRIATSDLRRRGMLQLTVADLNGDGWLDAKDITAFMSGVRPQPLPGPVPIEIVPVDDGEVVPIEEEQILPAADEVGRLGPEDIDTSLCDDEL